MAESWVRLWAGSTTDPKWQTIARKSGQPRYLVIALFTHLLMIANEAEDRGDISGMSIEDAASVLDCDEDQISDVLHAMEDRVIIGRRLAGWEKRQVFREDVGNEKTGSISSTERSRLHRERKRLESISNGEATQGNDAQRNATQSNAPEAEAEAEADNYSSLSDAREAELTSLPTRKGIVCGMLRKAGMADAAPHYLTEETWTAILAKRTDEEIIEVARAKMASMPNQRIGLKYIAKALLDDPEHITANARASPTSRRQTISDDRKAASMILTGRKPENERPTASTERDITADCQRIA